MNAPTEISPSERLGRLLVGLFAIVFAADVCFWKVGSWGISEALFFITLNVIVLLDRPAVQWRRTTQGLVALLAGTALANLIEPGFSNFMVWLILTMALAGDANFEGIREQWGRWLSQAVAMARAPGRVFWLAAKLILVPFAGRVGILGTLAQGFVLIMPAAALLLIFGSLLALGNAMFAVWTRGFFNASWTWLQGYLDPFRIFLWLAIALVTLPLLRPVAVSDRWWKWTQALPRFRERKSARAAVFSSSLTLLSLSLLFLAANAADAIFLWHGAALPAGVNYSQYVHHGVNFLVATVLLSAFVLTAVFQQGLGVVRSRPLKALGLFWVVQNLFLLMSVALRLERYIDAYGMSVARLGVVIFLLLVAAGYGLLVVKIVLDRSLSWLVGGCVLAVIATFYVTQFLDLAGWTADDNVARWTRDRSSSLDIDYLHRLGPAAWPALARAHRIDPRISVLDSAAREETTSGLAASRCKLDLRHWREFSLRAWLNRGALDGRANN